MFLLARRGGKLFSIVAILGAGIFDQLPHQHNRITKRWASKLPKAAISQSLGIQVCFVGKGREGVTGIT